MMYAALKLSKIYLQVAAATCALGSKSSGNLPPLNLFSPIITCLPTSPRPLRLLCRVNQPLVSPSDRVRTEYVQMQQQLI